MNSFHVILNVHENMLENVIATENVYATENYMYIQQED